MDKKEIFITNNAYKHIESICNYIAIQLCNYNASLSFLNLLNEGIERVAYFPEAYPIIDREPWKSKEIRKTIVKSFIIYYFFSKEKNRISILAVIYGKKDQLNELKKLDF